MSGHQPADRPTLHIIAGPNGAGKTTLYEADIRNRTRAEFVNADRLVMERLGRAAMTQEEAALGQSLADARRCKLMGDKASLVTESTFSHPSKLELVKAARDAGYRVVVYHVGIRDADRAVARVGARVQHGGHPVPEDRIRGRFERNQPLIREAALLADHAYVFDNSALGKPPSLLLQLEGGNAVFAMPDAPDWARILYEAELSAALG